MISNKLHFQQGFSLLECLCTLVLIAVICTLSLMGWQTIKNKQTLLFATETVFVTLQNLKKKANQQNTMLEIIVEQQNENVCFRLISDNDCLLILENIEMKLSQSVNSIIFYGERSTAQANTLSLKNDYAEIRFIIGTFNRIRTCIISKNLSGLEQC